MRKKRALKLKNASKLGIKKDDSLQEQQTDIQKRLKLKKKNYLKEKRKQDLNVFLFFY